MKLLIAHHNPACTDRIGRLLDQETTHVVVNCQADLLSQLESDPPDAVLIEAALIQTFYDRNLAELDIYTTLLIDPSGIDVPDNVIDDFDDVLFQTGSDTILRIQLQKLCEGADHKQLQAKYDTIYQKYIMELLYFDKTGKIYLVNKEHINRMGGYDVEDLTGANIQDFIPISIRSESRRHILKVLRGEMQIFDSRFICKNGDLMDISVRSLPVYEDGRVVGVSSVVRNITDRKKLERAIEAARRKYQLLFRNAGDAIFILNESTGLIQQANRQALKTFAYEPDEIIGYDFFDLWANIDRPTYQTHLEKIRKTDVFYLPSAEFASKTGARFYFDLTVTIIDLEGESIIQVIMKDISEKKKLEKLKDDLISMIVHDLKNPLMSIMMSNELLSACVDVEDPDVQQSIDLIRYNSETLLLMINDMLDLQKMEAGQLQLQVDDHDIYSLIHESVDQMRVIRQAANVDIFYEFEDNLAPIRVDREIMKRVFINILSNAFKFTPPGGWIRIHLKQVPDGLIQVSIADNGEGIPEEYVERIFDKFIQAKSRKSGHTLSTGLGLTFCKLAIQTHKGQIWVESKLGKGSTFHFSLPISPDYLDIYTDPGYAPEAAS